MASNQVHQCPPDGSIHQASAGCMCAPQPMGRDEHGNDVWQHRTQDTTAMRNIMVVGQRGPELVSRPAGANTVVVKRRNQ